MSAVPSPSPTFSVVMPLYNKREWARATLETVLAQRTAAHEVIVVDDGSTDGSPEAITDLIGGAVRLVRQPNAGPGPARNKGARMATGEWVALIDADDRWHPEHLQRLAETIAAFPDVDLVATTTRWLPGTMIDGNMMMPADSRPRRLDLFAETNLGEVHTSSVAIRRRAFLATEGFGAFIPGEDVEFWIRFALDHRLARSPVPTSIYVRQNGGIMEQEAVAAEAPAVRQPFQTTLNRALADERYRTRWDDIASFADRAALIAARNMLYVGDGRRARAELSRLRGAAGRTAWAYRTASYLPGPILRRGARLYGALKLHRA